eukprot:TRINITY_DN4834_c0_g1_i1.p1 TRINITY_DN4834_c0_g1~~TRINITY_DN4834_c0_g1_i1.p1  ORF type:complete len:387 (+),score=127.74 TRINITY_DN4834_c0_g1_i1:46-1206(+)
MQLYYFLILNMFICLYLEIIFFFFFQAEDGIRDAQESRGLGDVYKRQVSTQSTGCGTVLIDPKQIAQCQELIDAEIGSWRLEYQHVLKFVCPRTDGLSFIAVLSKPCKTHPIPDPVIRLHWVVHVAEELLADGRPPMSFLVENQRLRHWVGDGTCPGDSMFDAIGRQKVRSRELLASVQGSIPLLGDLDDATKAHRQIMDNLRRSTKFNEVELGKVVEIFEELAVPDPIGTEKVLEREQLIAGLTKLEEHGLAQMDWSASGLVNAFFHIFDVNESGTIDLKEFGVGVAMLTKGTLKEKIKLAFDIIDVNKSGTLDKEEMLAFLKCLIQSGPAAAGSKLVTDEQLDSIVEQAFSVIDKNKDDKIQFHEFSQWAASGRSGNLIAAAFC